MLFENLIRMCINEVVWVIFTYSHFISGDFNLEKVIHVLNIKMLVWYTLAIIYNQFS